MAMNKIITSNKNHPLFDKISKLDGFIELDNLTDQSCDLLIDLTATDSDSKRDLFNRFKCPIITDLSLNNGDKILKEFRHIEIAVSTIFPSPNLKAEVFYSLMTYKNELLNLFEKLDLKPVEVKAPGIGFIFGRTIVQIINEAWFALEDDLATEDAIDTAMLFGVNYPRGPLSWGAEAGLKNSVTLLKELHKTTNQDRYKVCDKLQKACL